MSLEELIDSVIEAWRFFHHNQVLGQQFLIDRKNDGLSVSIVHKGDSTKNKLITGSGLTAVECFEDLRNQCMGFIEEVVPGYHQRCKDEAKQAETAKQNHLRTDATLKSRLKFLLEHKHGKKIDCLFVSDEACKVSPTKTHVYPGVYSAGDELKCLFCGE